VTEGRILVVDDNESNLKLMTYLLSAPEYEVRTAADARQALQILPGFRPHLILLDIQLPDIDGLELARRLKADPVTRPIIIIAVTAYAMKGDEAKARAAGVQGYVTKPIEKQSFRRLVQNTLSKRGKS
jgi:CheY-like chemotaxis protein